MYIVPNELRYQINAIIDRALDGQPVEYWERESWFSQILDHFNEHGTLPEIEITKNDN